MDCAERARLADVLRVATHEVAWVQAEEVRLAAEEPLRLQEFGQLVEAAEAHRKEALTAYVRHLLEHGCGQPRSMAANGGARGAA
jgi:hypothetical protein